MANFSELSGMKQWGISVGLALLVSVALFFTYFKTQRNANANAQAALDAKLKENAQLEPYRSKLADMDRQVANLKQQLDIERRIVPDEKEVDGFIKMLDAEALKAGVWLRRPAGPSPGRAAPGRAFRARPRARPVPTGWPARTG